MADASIKVGLHVSLSSEGKTSARFLEVGILSSENDPQTQDQVSANVRPATKTNRQVCHREVNAFSFRNLSFETNEEAEDASLWRLLHPGPTIRMHLAAAAADGFSLSLILSQVEESCCTLLM